MKRLNALTELKLTPSERAAYCKYIAIDYTFADKEINQNNRAERLIGSKVTLAQSDSSLLFDTVVKQ